MRCACVKCRPVCLVQSEPGDGIGWICTVCRAHVQEAPPAPNALSEVEAQRLACRFFAVPHGLPEGYESLAKVLGRALEQASAGKGRERHATGAEGFSDQQIVQLGRWMETTGFNVGQAAKKALESMRLPKDRAVAELLGAINYLAAAVILREEGSS